MMNLQYKIACFMVMGEDTIIGGVAARKCTPNTHLCVY